MESELQLLCQCLNANHDDRKDFDRKFTAYYQKIAGTPNNPSKFFNWLTQITSQLAGGMAEDFLDQTINKILVQLRDRPNIALRLQNNISELNVDLQDNDIQKQYSKNWKEDISSWINNIMGFYTNYNEILNDEFKEMAKEYNDSVVPLQINGSKILIEKYLNNPDSNTYLNDAHIEIKKLSSKNQAINLHKLIAKKKIQMGIDEVLREMNTEANKNNIEGIEKLLNTSIYKSIPIKKKETIKALGGIKLVEEIKLSDKKAKKSNVVFIAEVEDILQESPEFRMPLLTWVINKNEIANYGVFETVKEENFIDLIDEHLKNKQFQSVSQKQKKIIKELEIIELVKGVGKIEDVVFTKEIEDVLKKSPEYRIPLLAWVLEKKGKGKLEKDDFNIDLMGYILAHASDLKIPLMPYLYEIAKNSVTDYKKKNQLHKKP